MATYTYEQSVAGGHASHRIKDYAIEPQWFEGGVLYGGAPVHVLTPSQGWHIATPRERRILRERHGVKIWVDVPRPPKRRRKASARA